MIFEKRKTMKALKCAPPNCPTVMVRSNIFLYIETPKAAVVVVAAVIVAVVVEKVAATDVAVTAEAVIAAAVVAVGMASAFRNSFRFSE